MNAVEARLDRPSPTSLGAAAAGGCGEKWLLLFLLLLSWPLLLQWKAGTPGTW